MKVNYNIQKEERKAMVAVVSKVLDTKPAYCGAPTFSYKIGAFEITKDGSLCFDDGADEATVARVRTALREAGFMSEGREDETSCGDTAAKWATTAETATSETPCEDTAANDSTLTETADAEADSSEDTLSISLPRSLFTETALNNLDALLRSKGRLIRHAFDIREATYTLEGDRITFAWLHGTITDETAKAYAAFISKLCEMARTQKRVTAKEKIVDNEKYAFRCFLLRLGMIGNAYKMSRKILLQNLTGSSAFKSGHRKGAEDHAVSE
ncbi:virulence protein [Selenomonas sp. oral taxon 126]|uniref:virulence protein n=1 Tax=Selenomonas sp. oral taxon 126 TaxID=712528 RepID=UPI000807805E|nr:virulence protein [Selenomonas sp. oral taxon 126]ANR71238.1 virulence protein [Selenomonas sp. oral taxon 126]